MQGFIGVHRKLMQNAVWTDPNYLKLWMYCMFKASHKQHEQLVGNQKVKLEVGEFITGRDSLETDMNRGVKPKQRLDKLTWFRYLKNLEKWEMVELKTTNKYTIVTITNYSLYQAKDSVFTQLKRVSEHQTEQQKDDANHHHDNVHEETVLDSEQQLEHQLNIKRTSDEQQLNTNKKGNNDKNENNDKKSSIDYTSKIKDLLSRYGSISDFIKLNKEYWDVIRETRTTGKIAQSVIHTNMSKWCKYDPVVVQYSLKTHIEAHQGKKEGYTIGIMRGTTKEEAEDRLVTKKTAYNTKGGYSSEKDRIAEEFVEKNNLPF